MLCPGILWEVVADCQKRQPRDGSLTHGRRHAEIAQSKGVSSRWWLRSWWGLLSVCLCVFVYVCVQLCTAAPQIHRSMAPSAVRQEGIWTAKFAGPVIAAIASLARAQLSAGRRLMATTHGTHRYLPARVRAEHGYAAPWLLISTVPYGLNRNNNACNKIPRGT